MTPDEVRGARLREAGADASVLDELLAYGRSLADVTGRPAVAFPTDDEAHVAAWDAYAAEAATVGALAALRPRFVQLACPVLAGISQDPRYRAATRQGRFDEALALGPAPPFERPDAIRLSVVETLTGRVPVVVADARGDFERLVRCLTARNEPEAVPPTMGACLVSGLINWDRVRRHEATWRAVHPAADEADWQEEWRRFSADRAAYQDRVLLLSTGPYSGLRPDGFDPADWLARSLVVRREHECAHYATFRAYGVVRTHVFDEILADFVGLLRAFGRYDGALARAVLGVDAAGRRLGGRIENYRGSPPLSDAAFDMVAVLAARATAALESAWDGAAVPPTGPVLVQWVRALCTLPLEALSSPALGDAVAAAGVRGGPR